MSLVVVIKDKDRFVVGADKQGTLGGNKTHTSTKVWYVKGYNNMLMAGVGLCRANQVLQYTSGLVDRNDFANGEIIIDEEYVAMVVAPTIYKVLEMAGITVNAADDESGNKMIFIPNSIIFAYKDRAWMIGQDLTVEEIDDYVAIGSGAEIARGVLYATRDKNPFERIAMAIDAASQETTTVDDYIDCLATIEKEDDERLFSAAVGNEELSEEEVAELISKMVITNSTNQAIEQVAENKKDPEGSGNEQA